MMNKTLVGEETVLDAKRRDGSGGRRRAVTVIAPRERRRGVNLHNGNDGPRSKGVRREWTALDLRCLHRADSIANPRKGLYAGRGITPGCADGTMPTAVVLGRGHRIVMVRRVSHRHVAGQVRMSSAGGIANRRRDRRRDQQHCQHDRA
jgi:hypothetical protein